MKNIRLLIIPLFCLLSACNHISSKQIDNKDTLNTEQTDYAEIERVALSFHKWYLNTIESDDTINASSFIIEKGDDGMCKINYEPYFKELRSLGTISEKFLDRERARLSKCTDYLETIHYATYMKSEGYELEDYCPELYYYYWIRSQEPYSPLSVLSSTIDTDNQSAHVDASLGSYNFRVFLQKESGKWKIVQISFLDDNNQIETLKENTTHKNDSIWGRWKDDEQNIFLDIYPEGINISYHGQCVYFYKTKVLNSKEIVLIWDYNMDCKFDISVSETFGLKNHPVVGKPFAKYTLETRDLIYVDYFYPEWINAYSKNVNAEAFIPIFHRVYE